MSHDLGNAALGERRRKPQYAPTRCAICRTSRSAAAEHYSGATLAADGRTIPAIRLWTAWNEPNQPFQLSPQYKKVRGKWVMQSAIDYAKMCTAVYTGVHSTLLSGEKGRLRLTAPLGNDNPGGKRRFRRRLSFMRAVKNAGLSENFDAWAHNPYASSPKRRRRRSRHPGRRDARQHRRVIAQMTKLWGPQAALADRVRLPDQPARQDVRRVVVEAGAVPKAGVRDRAEEPARGR
jgi:hypothetical protein